MFFSDFWMKAYTRDDIYEDTKWILLLAAASTLQAGLVELINIGSEGGLDPLSLVVLMPAAAAIVFIALALPKNYWLRFVGMVAWLAYMVMVHVMIKPVLFNYFLAIFPVYFIYKMLRYAKAAAVAPPADKPNDPWAKTLATLLLCSLAIAPLQAWAEEMMDVKGKGVITGTVLSEDDNFVEFKDAHGQKMTIFKKDIQYRETMMETKAAVADKTSKTKGGKSSASSDSKGGFMDDLKSRFSEGMALGMGKKGKDGAAAKDPKIIIAEMMKDRRVVNQESPLIKKIMQIAQNPAETAQMPLAMAGMALMAVGGIAVLIYGFGLFMHAFQEGIGWAFWFMGIPLSGFLLMSAPLFGIILWGLSVLIICYFILSHWSETRKYYVPQLFSLDVVLAGALLLVLAG